MAFTLFNSFRSDDIGKPSPHPQYKHSLTLITRLTTATLPEDRITALDDLFALYTAHPDCPIDEDSVHSLITVALADDNENASTAMECIMAIIRSTQQPDQSTTSSRSGDKDTNGDDSVGESSSNSRSLQSMFTNSKRLIAALLSLLTAHSAMVKLQTVQLLTILLFNKRQKMQDHLLDSVMSIQAIIELLADSNEALRNEALLLLEAAVARNTHIQQMVMFNEGIDALFGIVINEGGLIENGGVIGEDCMRIVYRMVRDSQRNCQLIIELGGAKYLAQLFALVVTHQNERRDMNYNGGVAFAIDILYVMSGNPSVIGALSPCITPLLDIAFANVPVAIRYMSLSIIAALVNGHPSNQKPLLSHVLRITPPPLSLYRAAPPQPFNRAAVNHLMTVAFDSVDSMESELCEYVLHAFLRGNAAAQMSFALDFASVPHSYLSQTEHHGHDDGDVSMSALLLQGLIGARAEPPSYSSAHQSHPHLPPYLSRVRGVAARIQSTIIRNHFDCQLTTLKLVLKEERPGGMRVLLVDKIIEMTLSLTQSLTLPDGQDRPILEISLLQLICAWIDGCAEAAEYLFSRQSFLQHLLTLATTHSSIDVRGVAAYTFALCLEILPAQPTSVYSFLSPQSLLSLITRSLTLDVFRSTLNGFMSSPLFVQGTATKDRSSSPYWYELAIRTASSSSSSLSDENNEHTFSIIDEDIDRIRLRPERTIVFDIHFVTRFKQVADKVDQRLLTLFATQSLSTTDNNTLNKSPHLHPNGMNNNNNNKNNNNAAHHDHNAMALKTLREENDRLRQQMTVYNQNLSQSQSAMSNGRPSALITVADTDEFQAERRRVSDLERQLQAANSQMEQQTRTIAYLQEQLKAAQQTASSSSLPSSNVDIIALQKELAELKSEHEDLLVLLASYENDADSESTTSISMTSANSAASPPPPPSAYTRTAYPTLPQQPMMQSSPFMSSSLASTIASSPFTYQHPPSATANSTSQPPSIPYNRTQSLRPTQPPPPLLPRPRSSHAELLLSANKMDGLP